MPTSANNATPLSMPLLPVSSPLPTERPVPPMCPAGTRRRNPMTWFSNEHGGSSGGFKDVVYAFVEQ